MTITVKAFIAATGRKPVQDDMDRVNCERAGECGHMFCGWNTEKNLPRFMTEPFIKPKED